MGVLYTSLVPAQRAGEASIATTAHLFQQFVRKAHDVRLTVVDDQFFAAAIHDRDPANVVDWRRSHQGLSYQPCTVPPEITTRVRDLVRQLGLRFAAIDFLATLPGTGSSSR